ncbi:MAG: Gfo/Idh/MocA family oxidoreductase [Nocardioidaceae bacterium]|jgi:predicted dehydrogenase|nr:Gfo/Idh/MocA family oxidoreductase [Nocardioidaceae bacterium]
MHAPMLARGPQTRLAAVWARKPDAARDLARAFGSVAVGSHDELLDVCEAVAYAVPPDVQADLAPVAARAGRAVMLEKPLGLDLRQARGLAETVSATGVPNILVLTKRFHPSTGAFLDRAARLRADGPITGVLAAYLHGFTLRGGASTTPWRLDHGALLDLGPHLVDLVDAAAGPIRSVRATGDPRTYLTVSTEHDDGVGQLALSCAVAIDSALTRVEVFSDQGSARWDTAGIDHDACWPVLCAEFAGAVRHGTAVRADVERGLSLQLVLDAVSRSLTEDRRVVLDE